MNNNVHILPVAKKPPRRGRAPALPRAEVLRTVDYVRRRKFVDTPEQIKERRTRARRLTQYIYLAADLIEEGDACLAERFILAVGRLGIVLE